jgi:hypothetical protein
MCCKGKLFTGTHACCYTALLEEGMDVNLEPFFRYVSREYFVSPVIVVANDAMRFSCHAVEVEERILP